jgi:hypothetical protein
MKKHVFSILLAALLPACAAFDQAPRLLYGIEDPELDLLGERLGYHVEALGMSVYLFTRGSHRFLVSVHNDISIRRRLQADAPVVLKYDPRGHRPPVEYRFSVERGVTFAAVEDHFRRFLREVDLPARWQGSATDSSALVH